MIWYGAKTIFAHDDIAARQLKPCYEERVVLLRAEDDDDALRLAEPFAEVRRIRPAHGWRSTSHVGRTLGARIGCRGGTRSWVVARLRLCAGDQRENARWLPLYCKSG